MYKVVGSKRGSIKKDTFKKSFVGTLVLSFGVLAIGSGFYFKDNIEENKNTDRIINSSVEKYSNDYSRSLEEMLGVSIADSDRALVNTFCDYLQRIDDYEKVGIGVDNKFIPISYEVETAALDRLKSGLAKENGVSKSDIKIYVGTYGNKVTVSKDGKNHTYSLKGDAGRLSGSIAGLQSLSDDFPTRSDANMKTYNNYVRNIIIDTIKYVNNKDDYKLPIDVSYNRLGR